MNHLQRLPATHWNFSPMQNFRMALTKYAEAEAIGHECDECGLILIDDIVLRNNKRYHYACR